MKGFNNVIYEIRVPQIVPLMLEILFTFATVMVFTMALIYPFTGSFLSGSGAYTGSDFRMASAGADVG
jgi:hypothetical protein